MKTKAMTRTPAAWLAPALLIAGLALFCLNPVAAQSDSLDDSLFGSGSGVLPGEAAASPSPAVPNGNQPAKTEASVKLGGVLNLSVGLGFDPTHWDSSFSAARDVLPTIKMGTKLFVDARPSDSVRVFVKAEADYPFINLSNYILREAFSDLTIDDKVYLRLGKQTINWGVGYWFSPANVINLGNKDPDDPTAELVGPLAIKMQLPVGTDNYYVYAILQDMETKKTVGLGAKAEWVIGDTEIGLGGVYRPDQPWAVTATLSTRLWKFDIYGEAVLKGQDDRRLIIPDSGQALGISIGSRKDLLEAGATIGINWSWSDDAGNINLSAGGQYYYNGGGYADQSIFTKYAAGVAMALGNGSLNYGDLYQRGQHYAGATLALSDFFRTGLGLSEMWYANLQDQSGKLVTTLSYKVIDQLRLSLLYTLVYGQAGSEFSPAGLYQSFGVSLDLVGLNF